ncbi:50S ribosomal protein L24 [Candidatus Pacearchaeota archaeon]|nr:50S ribosomal protein L24 [Candidatus Pacearchaeota archaeon]
MTKCFFCGRDERPFKGIHLIKNSGTINYFCSSKCRKNALNLHRDKRKIHWTLAYHDSRKKAGEKEEPKKSQEKEKQE